MVTSEQDRRIQSQKCSMLCPFHVQVGIKVEGGIDFGDHGGELLSRLKVHEGEDGQGGGERSG